MRCHGMSDVLLAPLSFNIRRVWNWLHVKISLPVTFNSLRHATRTRPGCWIRLWVCLIAWASVVSLSIVKNWLYISRWFWRATQNQKKMASRPTVSYVHLHGKRWMEKITGGWLREMISSLVGRNPFVQCKGCARSPTNQTPYFCTAAAHPLKLQNLIFLLY